MHPVYIEKSNHDAKPRSKSTFKCIWDGKQEGTNCTSHFRTKCSMYLYVLSQRHTTHTTSFREGELPFLPLLLHGELEKE